MLQYIILYSTCFFNCHIVYQRKLIIQNHIIPSEFYSSAVFLALSIFFVALPRINVRKRKSAILFLKLDNIKQQLIHYMNKLSKNALIGYPAGIITGITYGLNPLFGMPLMNNGASIESILFFRYLFAVILLGAFLVVTKHNFRITAKQAVTLLILGLLFTSSSICLFQAYNYIASGLATTLVFLYPVLVAIIMVFLRVIPSWPVWLAIVATFGGVLIMMQGNGSYNINPTGVALSLGSATAYALFIIIINRSKAIAEISNTLLTFYTLIVGSIVFFAQIILAHTPITAGISTSHNWLNLIGLALLPTIVSTATLAIATRNIGATKASVLGVFEPITAILVGTMVFGEPLTTNIILGISISVIAVTFMIAATKR